MPRPGWFIRKLQRVAQDTPEQIAERLRYRAAAEQVAREREERFPLLTAENVAEVLAWQEARIKDLTSNTPIRR
jgi:hypothetical protein